MAIKLIGDRADAKRCAIVSIAAPEIEARPPVLTLCAHAFSAEMRPHLAAGCTITQACAAVQRAHRAARAGGGHGGGGGDEDSSDDGESVLASIDY